MNHAYEPMLTVAVNLRIPLHTGVSQALDTKEQFSASKNLFIVWWFRSFESQIFWIWIPDLPHNNKTKLAYIYVLFPDQLISEVHIPVLKHEHNFVIIFFFQSCCQCSNIHFIPWVTGYGIFILQHCDSYPIWLRLLRMFLWSRKNPIRQCDSR